jgi:cyclin B
MMTTGSSLGGPSGIVMARQAAGDRNSLEETREQFSFLRSGVQADPSSYQMTGITDDIDERDNDDPQCVTAYVNDMYVHFREKEVVTWVRPCYMENQEYINEGMRSMLVDWFIRAHLKFKFVPETLYLTINLLDRFLEKKQVSYSHLVLAGVVSLLIASKYEESCPPELRDWIYICNKFFTKKEILEMEEKILKTLEYKVTIPSAHTFLLRYLNASHDHECHDREKVVQLSCYVLEGTLQSYNLLYFLPSQLAAAAVFIARRAVGINAWSPTLLKYAMYCEEEVIPVARAILDAKAGASDELRAVDKKYESSRYGGVAGCQLTRDF